MSTKTGECLRHIYLNLEFNLFQTLKKLSHGFLNVTFISLMDASVSTENDVSQLPLRDEAPPSEARVAAESVEAVLEP